MNFRMPNRLKVLERGEMQIMFRSVSKSKVVHVTVNNFFSLSIDLSERNAFTLPFLLFAI